MKALMKQTKSVNPADVEKKWVMIDAEGLVVGRVASIKEDTFVLETGSDRVKMRFKRWAIQDVEKLSLDTPADSSASK